MIRLVRTHNPFEPSLHREDRELVFHPTRNLRDYLIDASLDTDEIVVSLNGQIVSEEIALAIVPLDKDCIVVTPRIHGGSLFRALGQFAVLAASAALVATGVGAGLGAFLGFSGATALAVGNAILAGAVSIGGNLLISAIASALAPSKKFASPSYAFSGPSTTAQSGIPIPKGYGTFRSGGNIIASFVDIEGLDQYINCLVCYGFGPARSISSIQINGKDISTYQNVQYYTRLGTNDQTPIPAFNRVVNGYPQDTQCLAGVPVIVPGTGDLTQILFVDIVFPNGLFVLTNDGNYIPLIITYKVEYSAAGQNNWQPVIQPLTTFDVITYDPTTGKPNPYNSWVVVATDLPAGSGVVYFSDNGPHTPGDPWSGQQTVNVENPDTTSSSYTKTFYGEWQPVNLEINQVQVSKWTAGYVYCSTFGTQAIYQRTSIYGLAPGKYDVRITKYGSGRWGSPGDVQPGDNNSPNVGQELWIHSVSEVSLLDLAYPNMVLVGVRALATNQISGSNVQITALVEYGLRTLDNNLLPAELQTFEEDNPACVAADMMLDRLYGGGQYPGILPANLNRYIDEWVAWAELNDQLVDDGNGNSIRRHVFNGVFDSEEDLWTAVGAVAQMSRAAVIPLGRDYGVFIDAPAVPVQIFTMGSMVADSFTETWLELDARANQVEVQIADATRYYRQDNPIVYMDPANQNAGVAIKNTRVNGLGITVPAQAWHFARYRERMNEFLLRSGSFQCDPRAIACRPGNVVILQNDVPQWGFGGLTLIGSSTTAVVVDRNDLPFVAGTAYSLIVLMPVILRYTLTAGAVVASVDSTGYTVGLEMALAGFDNANRVTRAVVAGTDCLILSAAAGSLILTPPPGFTPAAGMPVLLYDTDVLETCAVFGVTTVENVQTVQLSTPLSQVPQDFSTYFYGPAGSQKLARIVRITKQTDFRSKVEWADYDAQVYVDATPTVGETSAQVTTSPGVTALTGTESVQSTGAMNVSYVNLSWQNGRDTVGVSIFAQLVGGNTATNGGLPQLVARLTGAPTTWQTQAAPGISMVYTVVGFDLNNNYQAFSKAPNVTVAPVGAAANLLLGSSFDTGFAYWQTFPRSSDTLTSDTGGGGEAVYTVGGSAITTPSVLYYQTVPSANWSVGQNLMLSTYVQASVPPASPNAGFVTLTLWFQQTTGSGSSQTTTTIGVAAATQSIGTGTPIIRLNTAVTVVPAGTTSILALLSVDGGSTTAAFTLPVGATVVSSHWLLQSAATGQTTPSPYSPASLPATVAATYTAIGVPTTPVTYPEPKPEPGQPVEE